MAAEISRLPQFTESRQTDKRGIVNFGNTCYMNSVVQALFMCDRLVSYVCLYLCAIYMQNETKITPLPKSGMAKLTIEIGADLNQNTYCTNQSIIKTCKMVDFELLEHFNILFSALSGL